MGTLNHRPRTPGRRPWAIIDAVASKSITPRKIPTVLMPTEHPRRLGARQIKSAARSSSNLFAALPRRPRPLRGGIEGCESCLWIAINRCCKPTSSLGSPSAGQHEMHRESASHAQRGSSRVEASRCSRSFVIGVSGDCENRILEFEVLNKY